MDCNDFDVCTVDSCLTTSGCRHAFADGAAHIVEIRYEYDDAGGSGLDGNIFIDDVTIDSTAARPSLKKPKPARPMHFSKRAR